MVACSCIECGKVFNRPPSGINKYVLCSKECSNTWQRKNAPKGENHHQYKREKVICDNCKIEFERAPFRNNRGVKNFCSVECRLVDFKQGNPNLGLTKSVPCDECGEMLSRSPALVKRHNFCSFDCRSLWYSKNYSGKNSPQYRDGKSDNRFRGKMWRTISRTIKERDGNACIKCGYKDDVKKLVVHHLIPAFEWDDVEMSNTHWNLFTFCQSCHSRITSNDEVVLECAEWDHVREYMNQYRADNPEHGLVMPGAVGG